MLQIQIKLQQIFYRLNFSNHDENSFYLKIYFKDDKIWKVIVNSAEFKHMNQSLDVKQIIYLKKNDAQSKQVSFKIFLRSEKRKEEDEENVLKFMGQCNFKIKEINLDQLQKQDITIKKRLKLLNSKDSQSFLGLNLKIKQIEQFKYIPNFNDYSNTQQNDKTPQILSQQLLSIKQIQLQYQSQLLQQSKNQKQFQQRKKLKYQKEISRIKGQTQELKEQLKQKKQLYQMNKKIREDKKFLLDKKVKKVEEEFKKTKSLIGDIFNVVNQYGSMEMVEDVGDIVAGKKYSFSSSSKGSIKQ